MALNSPGVQVSIIDESQYLPSASNSIPLLILATATNKASATTVGAIAPGTLASNANKLYQITSQRDLITLFGNPFFYKTTDGTPIHGYELNEYGLMAAYSLMGVTNSCYILRADIDLAELVGTLSRPKGPPPDGTYWLDTTNSVWGIYEFNAETGKFETVTPYVLTSPNSMIGVNNPYPLSTIGNPGDYAVIPMSSKYGILASHTFFYKTSAGPSNNVWVPVGTQEWKLSFPTATGTKTPISLTVGHRLHINIPSRTINRDVTVPASPNNTVTGLVNAINNLGIGDLYAKVESGSLVLYYGEYGRNKSIILSGFGSESLLADLGITPGSYFSPEAAYGPSAQMPLWTASQSSPRPSGSVWIKTSKLGNGMNLALNEYSLAKGQFVSKPVNIYQTELNVFSDLDPAGGLNIPAGTIIATANTQSVPESAVQLLYRKTTGPTVVTGSTLNPNLSSHIGTALKVAVTLPNSSALSNVYSVAIIDATLATFVTMWASQQIPNTKATVTPDGALRLEHTLGGDIYIGSTTSPDELSAVGISLGLSGVGGGLVPGVRTGFLDTYTSSALPQNSTTYANGSPGSGTGATFSVSNAAGQYVVNNIANGGTNYLVGDRITITGDRLAGASPTNDLTLVVQEIGSVGAITSVSILTGIAKPAYLATLSNWYPLEYIANEGAPSALPTPQKQWYYSTATEVDIMVKKGNAWVGYRNTNYDMTGHPAGNLLTGTGNTNATGIIMSAGIPITQDDGSALEYGDLWLNSSDLENYPNLSRWEEINGVKQWVAIDKTDQVSSSGILFADARWASSGLVDPINDPIPTITGLLTSDYLDLDAPDARSYPQGMLLLNTRRSGFNIKRFEPNWFTSARYPDAYPASDTNPAHKKLPEVPYTWVSSSGLKEDGSAYMGRKAQRNMVVQALKAAINTNMQIREEDTFINLLAAPNYPELQADMITLNNDRNQTAFIIGDTPLRLDDQATSIKNWATNQKSATQTGEDGWATRDSYLGVFYPSGITSDLSGTPAVVPASHMILRTFLTNDTIAYPWLAAAGVRRGNITNATSIGYLNSSTGEFQTIKNRMSIRDVLYTNQINPLAFFTGVGFLNYGNKTSFASNSALDRVNVARLVCYIRYQLQIAARPFVFEPNDALTRSQLTAVVQSLFIDLVTKRGLYDYLVICDESNNTPSRIDRNELWVDVAIEPVKAAEFIYIPVRIVNTGTLGGQ
jgi:hypothetical protein